MHSLCRYPSLKLYLNVFEVESCLGHVQKQYMNWRQHALEWLNNTFCELESRRAPSNFKHKQHELNVLFPRRPRWTTAEQVHTGAHTYTSDTMHCIPEPHVHACTVLRTSHMLACAIQRAHSLMHIHARWEEKSIWELCLAVAHEMSSASLEFESLTARISEAPFTNWLFMTHADQLVDADRVAVAWSLAWSAAWYTLGLHVDCTLSAPLSTNWSSFDKHI